MTESTEASTQLWRVQLMTGEVRAMSLDALDEAFQSGLIMESTPVLPPGATAWTKLADAAGLDASSTESNVPSVAPLAVSISDTGDATPYAQRPDLMDLDTSSIDEGAFKPKKGRMFAVVGLAVVLVGGLGFAASRLSAGIAASASNSLRAGAGNKAAATPPPAAVDLNDPAVAAKTLTEEQRAKLAEADKAREAREAQKRKDRPPPPTRRAPQPKSGTPFVNGGNKYDPLNGAL